MMLNIGHIIPSEPEFVWNKNQFRMIPFINEENGKSMGYKDIDNFQSVIYDELYGISGRLLVQCLVKYNEKKVSMFYQLFNQNELILLKQEFERNEYDLNPGTKQKPFNLIVYVFEMLYGSD